MITIKNVRTLDDQITDYEVASSKDFQIDAGGKLLLLPGIVDPHISFGTLEGKKWEKAVSTAIRGGITTLIEMPNKKMPCDSKESLEKKRKLVDQQLSALQAPLHYFFYAIANLSEIEQLNSLKQLIKGIVISLDSKKNEKLDDRWNKVFQMAALKDIPVILEDAAFLDRAIYYAEKQSGRLYILNVSTQQEIDLIKEARNRSLLVYAETTPQHLFQEDRSKTDPLWKALNEGVIETMGSGYHAEQPGKEKFHFKGENFSLSNPLFLLPLLLTAVQEGKTSIEQVVRLTGLNIHAIFDLQKTHDFVLVDLEKEEIIQKIGEHSSSKTITLKGWPVYTIVQGNISPTPSPSL